MKNRAKCKLCNDVLESFHTYDYVSCKCGEISISGGNDKLECAAKNWYNFIRVDDEGNEILVKIQDDTSTTPVSDTQEVVMSRDDTIDMLESMVKNIENLPKNAMHQPVTHYDLYTYMITVLAIFKKEKKD